MRHGPRRFLLVAQRPTDGGCLAPPSKAHKSWQAYTAAYLAEMRVSYTRNRPEWDRVLHMPSVTLLCYCASKYLPRCHRIVLAHLLTRLDMTAVYLGEIP
jgi:hypothetical protein